MGGYFVYWNFARERCKLNERRSSNGRSKVLYYMGSEMILILSRFVWLNGKVERVDPIYKSFSFVVKIMEGVGIDLNSEFYSIEDTEVRKI